MVIRLGVDFETRSEVDITKTGSAAYARHPSTEVLCMAAVCFDDEANGAPIWEEKWVPALMQKRVPDDVREWIRQGGLLLAHNADFERNVFEHVLGLPTEPGQWMDTVDMALLVGLPPGLEALGKALGIEVQKDMEGNALMRQLSYKLSAEARAARVAEIEERAATARTGPQKGAVTRLRNSLAQLDQKPTVEQLERLLRYCHTDVLAMIEVFMRLPKPPAVEVRTMAVNRRINDDGVHIDLELAEQMSAALDREQTRLVEDANKATGIELTYKSPTPIVAYAQDMGYPLRSLKKDQLDAVLADEQLPPELRVMVETRAQMVRSTSLAKLRKLADVLCPDGKVRGSLRYAKAHTGRWAGSGLQLHNVRKPGKKFPWELALQAVAAGDLDMLANLSPSGSVLDTLSQMLRLLVVAEPGYEFIAGDYSAIEARVLPWLACDEEKLKLFRDGVDTYVLAAERVGSDNRQLGKVQELGLGYGMGPIKFAVTGKGYGIDLPLLKWREIQRVWRKANAKIVQFWADLESAAREAILHPKTVHHAGLIEASATKTALRLRLPSGRCLHYWRPKVRPSSKKVEVLQEDGTIVTKEFEVDAISFYRGGGTGMMREETYGGRLAENVTQATAREVLRDAVLRLEPTPYRVNLHVHDSVISKVREGTGDVAEFEYLLTEPLPWSSGLPLDAEGYRSKRFHG